MRAIGYLALMAAAAAGAAGPPPAPSAASFVPAGARIGPSGFATIGQVPPSPFPETLPPPENRPRGEAGFYARMAGISEVEARRRLAGQQAARPEFERLLGTLRAREAGNYTDARMVHSPDWAYIFYFRRDPERTLARYTSNPRFRAARARYGQEELRAIAKPWVERFNAHRLLGGYGTDATYGEVRMDLVVSEAEYRSLAGREGWSLPDSVKLHFSDPVDGPPVAEQARTLIRVFPQSDRALGPTNQALLGGRIELRDGCFYVTGLDRPDRLAYFAREVAVGLDAEGYLSLRSRGPAPRHLGRIGEQFSWGGPIGTSEAMPMVAQLRARCGDAPLEHVGVPQSARLFSVRPWVVDAIAARRGIGRDEAWLRFRSCLEEREARRPGFVLDCDTI